MSRAKRKATPTNEAPRWAQDVAKLPISPDAKDASTLALRCLGRLIQLSAVVVRVTDEAEVIRYGAPYLDDLKKLIIGGREKVKPYVAEYVAAKAMYGMPAIPKSTAATAHETVIDAAHAAVVLWDRSRIGELRERLGAIDLLALKSAVVKESAATQGEVGAEPDEESNYIRAARCRWGDIDTHKKLLGIIKRQRIRTKRNGQRLLVHAGDWARHVGQREQPAQAMMDDPAVAELLGEAAQRQAEIRARKAKMAR